MIAAGLDLAQRIVLVNPIAGVGGGNIGPLVSLVVAVSRGTDRGRAVGRDDIRQPVQAVPHLFRRHHSAPALRKVNVINQAEIVKIAVGRRIRRRGRVIGHLAQARSRIERLRVPRQP